MKRFIKYPFALALLSAATGVHNTHAIRYVWFDEPFIDTAWVDDLMDWHRQSMELFRQRSIDYGPSKEDREAIKAAREKLAKIKHTITVDDQKVTIQFTGFDALDKKDIEIEKLENSLLKVTIITKEGTIEFKIAQNGLQVDRRIEIKKEDKDTKDKKERISYASSLHSDLEYFMNANQNKPFLIDIHTAKVEPVKDNTLTIVIQKQKKEILPIP